LPVRFAETGMMMSSGHVYVARPLGHLIINADRTLTVAEPRRGFAKPSADWLFDTLAPTYGDNVIAIVLSGYQRDGARGVVRIRDAGGLVIVQEPGSCDARDMPDAAIATGCARWVLPPELIASAILDRLQILDLERARRAFENPFAA
jgi:two-component system chemotaxis response regulator CheB